VGVVWVWCGCGVQASGRRAELMVERNAQTSRSRARCCANCRLCPRRAQRQCHSTQDAAGQCDSNALLCGNCRKMLQKTLCARCTVATYVRSPPMFQGLPHAQTHMRAHSRIHTHTTTTHTRSLAHSLSPCAGVSAQLPAVALPCCCWSASPSSASLPGTRRLRPAAAGTAPTGAGRHGRPGPCPTPLRGSPGAASLHRSARCDHPHLGVSEM
jgi:hypothetical protein